jgi:phage terminase small subunit
MIKKLTPKQQAFVDEYLIDFNATRAAIKAGYSEKTAKEIGAENLTKPNIQQAISNVQRKRSERTEITQDYVLITIQQTIERCKQAEPVLDREGAPTGEYKFDSTAVLKGCDLLGKHLGMFKDKVELSGPDGGPVQIDEGTAAAKIAAIMAMAQARKDGQAG